jgi:bifunctional non-homologous end joining protein LigD
VIAYYQAVAPWFVTHAARRPATRKRWPNGVGTPEHPQRPFFHKNLDPKSTPDWVATYTIEHSDGPNTYPLIDDAATLVWLAQLASSSCTCRNGEWAGPDDQAPGPPGADLDPGEGAGCSVRRARPSHPGGARRRRVRLVPVTSGSKGIHLTPRSTGR